MKTLLDETNHMRRLMGLSLLVEQSNGKNLTLFEGCLKKFVIPKKEEGVEEFLNRTDLKNENCRAIRDNLKIDDNLFNHNDHKLWKEGDATKINVLTACFQSVPENENEGTSDVDCEGNKPSSGGGVGRVWCFLDCFKWEN